MHRRRREHRTSIIHGSTSLPATPQTRFMPLPKLCWRTEDQVSDWTIEICEEEEDDDEAEVAPSPKRARTSTTDEPRVIDVYYVHRSVIAFGPRGSGYFHRLFFTESTFAESTERTSRIVLDKRAKEWFPNFLDYIYHGSLTCKPEDAMLANYFGQYFDVEALVGASLGLLLKSVIRSSIAAAKFIDDSYRFGLSETRTQLARRMAKNLTWMRMRPPFDAAPSFWDEFTVAFPQDSKDMREKYERRLLPWIEACSSRESFALLTSKAMLPSVHPPDAIFLLREAERFYEDSQDPVMVSLEERCEHALRRSKLRSGSAIERTDELKSAVRSLRPETLARLFLALAFDTEHDLERMR